MKWLLCFCGILLLVFPLFNVQKKDVFAFEKISEIYFVRWQDGKQEVLRQEKKEFSQMDLAKNQGVVLTIEKSSVDEVCEQFDVSVSKQESVNDMKIVYGWTNLQSNFVWLKGKQTNVQIVKKENKIIVGFPMVFCGF